MKGMQTDARTGFLEERLDQQVVQCCLHHKSWVATTRTKRISRPKTFMAMNNEYFVNKLACAVHIIMAPVDDVYELYPLKHYD